MGTENEIQRFLNDYSVCLTDFAVVFTVEKHHDGIFGHMSVARPDRYPSWDEMMQLRAVMFDDDAEVVQLMPPCEEYVNVHNNCFHLWHRRDSRLIPDTAQKKER